MPKFFIPARNSRHRRACLALYKALLRKARDVPVPDHMPSIVSGRPALFPVLRHAFEMNRADISPRLVVSALDKGYKGLDVLEDARVPGSPTHERLIRFLETRPAAVATAQARADAKAATLSRGWRNRKVPPPDKPVSRPSAVPLLTRVPVEGAPHGTFGTTGLAYEFYKYVPTERPLPLAEIRARAARKAEQYRETHPDAPPPPIPVRKVPVLASDSTGIPFLRLARPQSRLLSHIIFQKRSRRMRRMGLASRMLRDDLPFAAEEDRWEATVTTLLAQQHQQTAADGKDGDDSSTTYAASVSMAIQFLWTKLNTEAADMTARAQAMLELVNAEQKLADEEAAEVQRQAAAAGISTSTNTSAPAP